MGESKMMIIRKAILADIEGITKIFLDYEKASMSYLPKKYKSLRNKKAPIDKNIRLALLKDIRKKNSLFLVVEEEKRIVGYISGYIRTNKRPFWSPPKTGELEDIAILKKYLGKGIAEQLWHGLLNWFKKEKCEFVTLCVKVNNNAQEIYKKWGFEVFYLRMVKKL